MAPLVMQQVPGSLVLQNWRMQVVLVWSVQTAAPGQMSEPQQPEMPDVETQAALPAKSHWQPSGAYWLGVPAAPSVCGRRRRQRRQGAA